MITNKEFEIFNKQLQKTILVKKTEKYLNEIWRTHENEFKYLFGLRLFEYAQGKHYDYTTTMLPVDSKSRSEIIGIYRKRRGASSSSLLKQFQRLSIGYNSISYEFTPKRCNLSSEEANLNYQSKNTTNDHIIGATLCSQYVIEVFLKGKESNKQTWVKLDWLEDRIDYMCNEWLKHNLWLWAQCRITKDEHNPKNGLLRNMVKESIFEEIVYRSDLEHYDVANIVMALDYKNIKANIKS